jgi:uncharacterized protein involved in exopolysaccharide biosynthesis
MAKRVQRSLANEPSTGGLLDPVHIGLPSLGIQYNQVVADRLGKLMRHKLLILAMVAAALVLGVIATLAMPKRYTAEAYIREGVAASDSGAGTRGSSVDRAVAFDASLLVETRAQLFQSLQLARQVVESLGFERLRPAVGQGRLSSWLQAEFYGDATRAPGYQEDIAATKLMRNLSVKTEPRVYQITLSYSAKDPELAAAITNAFVVEFLRTTSLQKLSGQRAAAQAELLESLATLGDKHPKVREARMRLANVDALMKEELSKSSDDIEQSAGENITFAQASVIPSSPNPPLILGIALFVGLAAGVGMALWLERGPKLERMAKSALTGDRTVMLPTFLRLPVPPSAQMRSMSRALRRRALRQNG